MTRERVWTVISMHVPTQTHESGWLHVCFTSACDPSVYEQSKQKQTVSADTGVSTHQQQPPNDCINQQNPEYLWVTSEKKCSNILHAHFLHVSRHLFSAAPPSSLQLFPCLSVRICHCHPAQPGGQKHPAFSHPALTTPAGLDRSEEASLLISTPTSALCMITPISERDDLLVWPTFLTDLSFPSLFCSLWYCYCLLFQLYLNASLYDHIYIKGRVSKAWMLLVLTMNHWNVVRIEYLKNDKSNHIKCSSDVTLLYVSDSEYFVLCFCAVYI